jgi:hypothetical protein
MNSFMDQPILQQVESQNKPGARRLILLSLSEDEPRELLRRRDA